MKLYLIQSPYLPDGNYCVKAHPNWHERLRLKLAQRLFNSVKKPDRCEIQTTTGVIGWRDRP